MARSRADGVKVEPKIVREYRPACPKCGSANSKIYKTSHNERLGRTDRWRKCECGRTYRSYLLANH